MILLVHPTADLYGSDRVFLESVRALLQAGKQVVVSLPERGPLEHEIHKLGGRVEICPTMVLRRSIFRPRQWPGVLASLIGGFRQGMRLIKHEQPAAIYVNTSTIPQWNLLSRLSRTPLIVHVHEAESSAGFLKRTVLTLPLFLSTVTIANSRFSASVIEQSFKRLGNRIQVVHNAVAGPASPVPLRSTLSNPVRLAYIGRLSPRKGVDVVIDALASLEDRGVGAELDIIGSVFPGYEWYEQQLLEQIRLRLLTGKVRFHGFQRSIWDFVAESDIVVVPSRAEESFGNTAIESILAGRPVIASGTTGLLEATQGYGAATVVPADDPMALAAAVEALSARWADLRGCLAVDMVEANQRHGINRYREDIVAIVDSCSSSRR